MLDFSLLGQGPTFENAFRSYSAGKEDRRKTNVRNALGSYGTDPEGAYNALLKDDPDLAFKLQDRTKEQGGLDTRKRVLGGYGSNPETSRTEAMDSGDMELIGQIQKLDASQRQIAAQNADELGAVALALKQQPPEARKAALSAPQMTEWLASKGFKPEQIASFDPNDANLDAMIAQGSTLKDLLAQYKDERATEFEGKKFDETVRHNKATEGVAGKNADSKRISATRPRASSSRGGGIPALPSGFVIEK